MPVLFDVLHEFLEEERPVVLELHFLQWLFTHVYPQIQTHFLQKVTIDDDQQRIQWFSWQKAQNLFLYLSVPKLFLSIYFFSMCSNLGLGLLLHLLILEFLDKLIVGIFALIVIAEDTNEQPQYFRHDVSENEGDHDKDDDDVDALNWVFGGDVSVGDGSDHCDAEIHDVDVGLIPAEVESHLIERPTVVDPAEIGRIWSVIVVFVDPQAHQIEANPHVMCIQHAHNRQLYHQVNRIPRDIQLGDSLELLVDAFDSVELQDPDHFHPVGLQTARSQRNNDGEDGQCIDWSLQAQISAQDGVNIDYQKSVLVVGLQRRHKDVSYQHQSKQDVKSLQNTQLIAPELLTKRQQKSHLQDVEEHDQHNEHIPHKQEETIWSDCAHTVFVKQSDPLDERGKWARLRLVGDGSKQSWRESRCVVENVRW